MGAQVSRADRVAHGDNGRVGGGGGKGESQPTLVAEVHEENGRSKIGRVVSKRFGRQSTENHLHRAGGGGNGESQPTQTAGVHEENGRNKIGKVISTRFGRQSTENHHHGAGVRGNGESQPTLESEVHEDSGRNKIVRAVSKRFGRQNTESHLHGGGGGGDGESQPSLPAETYEENTGHKIGKAVSKRFGRHNTENHLQGSTKAPQRNLFRNASHGDFRRQFQNDIKAKSKSLGALLSRSESTRGGSSRVAYKNDFQTKYCCDFSSPLSHGKYATVTPAECFLTAKNVAVKIIRKDRLIDKKTRTKCLGENVTIEVLALQNLANQPNVVKFIEVYEDEAFFYVVLELLKGGNLLQRLNKMGAMKEEQAGPLLKQMLSVTRICHSRGISHRDLKPENFVFLSEKDDYPLNLVDFGSAAFFKDGDSRPFRGVVGTYNYMAPEVYDSQYGPSADVWSLGIIAYTMLCCDLPFNAPSEEELRNKIKYDNITFSREKWNEVSDSAKDLLRKMLEKNPDFRISTMDALAHPWLRQWEF